MNFPIEHGNDVISELTNAHRNERKMMRDPGWSKNLKCPMRAC